MRPRVKGRVRNAKCAIFSSGLSSQQKAECGMPREDRKYIEARSILPPHFGVHFLMTVTRPNLNTFDHAQACKRARMHSREVGSQSERGREATASKAQEKSTYNLHLCSLLRSSVFPFMHVILLGFHLESTGWTHA